MFTPQMSPWSLGRSLLGPCLAAVAVAGIPKTICQGRNSTIRGAFPPDQSCRRRLHHTEKLTSAGLCALMRAAAERRRQPSLVQRLKLRLPKGRFFLRRREGCVPGSAFVRVPMPYSRAPLVCGRGPRGRDRQRRAVPRRSRCNRERLLRCLRMRKVWSAFLCRGTNHVCPG